MKIVRVAHDANRCVEAWNCYGPFTDDEAWTFASKVDEVLFKRGLSKAGAVIHDVNPPREFLNPETGEPLDLS